MEMKNNCTDTEYFGIIALLEDTLTLGGTQHVNYYFRLTNAYCTTEYSGRVCTNETKRQVAIWTSELGNSPYFRIYFT